MTAPHFNLSVFSPDRVKRPQGKFWRWVIGRYVVWTEVFGYIFAAVVATGIVVCWVVKVDEVVKNAASPVPKLRPRDWPVKADEDVVVWRVHVPDWANVEAGAALADVIAEPDWVEQARVAAHFRTVAESLRPAADAPPLPPELAAKLEEAEAWLRDWEARQPPADKLRTLTAPRAGEVLPTKNIVGKALKKGDTVATVYDFNDLRFSVKFAGSNIERVRTGMPAKITIIPDYGAGQQLRIDARYRPMWSRRMQFNELIDRTAVRDQVAKALADQAFVTREDRKRGVALYPKEVKDMDLVCRVRASRLGEDGLDAAGKDNWIQPDVLGKIKDLRGEIIDGKHTALFQTNYIPEDLREEIRQQVWNKIGDKSARLPIDGDTSVPINIHMLRRARVYLKLQVEIKDLARPDADSPDTDWAAVREQTDADWKAKAKDAKLCDKAKDERNYEATVRLANPPPVVSAKLREIMQADPAAGLSAKVEAVVAKRRVALLLFRQ